MRFSLSTHIADVRCCARCTACRNTADVRTRAESTVSVWQENPILPMSHSSSFPYFIVVLVELGLIEGFSQIWRTQIFRSFRRHLSI
jgi:hypothetical protein